MEKDNYSCIVTESEGLDAKDLVRIELASNIVSIDKNIEDDADNIIMKVCGWAYTQTHNPSSTDKKDYESLIIKNEEGTMFRTSSTSCIEMFRQIIGAVTRAGLEEWKLTIFKKPSKKRDGKYYITCGIV